MTSRALKDRLLWRELSSQAHRRYGWTYPGPGWFLAATLLPPVALWKLTGGRPLTPEAGAFAIASGAFGAASLWQLWLLSLRSMIYPAVSMAHEFREGTLPVLRSTPISLSRALGIKLTACLLPLWAELGFMLVFNLVLYSLLGGLSPYVVVGGLILMLATSASFGGFGLWLGAVVGDPERAANSARALVSMLLLGTFMLEAALTWPLLLVGAVIWMCLVVQPQTRPGQAYQGGVAALVMLLLLPVFYTFTQNFMNTFRLSDYNPLKVLEDFTSHSDASAYHLLPILGIYLAVGALFTILTASRARAQI